MRAHYRPEEDEAIVRFVVKNESVYKANGEKLWRFAESQQITTHSWQSMQNRYKKNLKPKWSSLLWKFGIVTKSASKQPNPQQHDENDDDDFIQEEEDSDDTPRERHHGRSRSEIHSNQRGTTTITSKNSSKRPRLRQRTSTEPPPPVSLIRPSSSVEPVIIDSNEDDHPSVYIDVVQRNECNNNTTRRTPTK